MISCVVNGNLTYISRFRDFSECVDPSVYEAMVEFFDAEAIGDENPRKLIDMLRDRIRKLKEENDKIEEYNDYLYNERRELLEGKDRLYRENEDLKEKIDILTGKMAKIQEMAK